MVGIQQNSLYHLSITSCLLELIDKLKVQGKFNDTLNYMASEFNRSANNNSVGSGHGVPGAHVNLISGRIANYRLIGNILKDSAGVGSDFAIDYKGTWGHGAPIAGTELLTIPTFWASVMVLLGTPESALPNAINRSLLLFRNPGQFTVESGYNVTPVNVINASK